MTVENPQPFEQNLLEEQYSDSTALFREVAAHGYCMDHANIAEMSQTLQDNGDLPGLIIFDSEVQREESEPPAQDGSSPESDAQQPVLVTPSVEEAPDNIDDALSVDAPPVPEVDMAAEMEAEIEARITSNVAVADLEIVMENGSNTQIATLTIPEGTLRRDANEHWGLFVGDRQVEGADLEAFAQNNSIGFDLVVENGALQGNFIIKENGDMRYDARGTEANISASRAIDGSRMVVQDHNTYMRVERNADGELKESFWDGYSHRAGTAQILEDGRVQIAYTEPAAAGLPSPASTIRDPIANSHSLDFGGNQILTTDFNKRTHVRDIAGLQTTQYHDSTQWREGQLVKPATAEDPFQQVEFTDNRGDISGVTVDTRNGQYVDVRREAAADGDISTGDAAAEEQEATPEIALSYSTEQISEAIALARETGLPLVVHIGADWCDPCQRLENESWPSVQSNLAGHAIFLHLEEGDVNDLTDDSNQAQAAWLSEHPEIPNETVSSYPTVRVFRPDADGGLGRVDQFQGFLDAVGVQSFLQSAFDKEEVHNTWWSMDGR